MIIVKLLGGLGNQMFEYAMARRLAHRHQTQLKLDLTNYGSDGDQRARGLEAFRRKAALHLFNIDAQEATTEEIARLKDPYSTRSTRDRIVRRLRRIWPELGWPDSHILERQYRFDPAILDLPNNCYLSGYWQSEKYFIDTAELIRRDLTPRDESVLSYAREYVDNLKVGGSTIISLHVRRGDLAHAAEQLKNSKVVHASPLGLDYIQAAIRQFDHTCKFLVFSDSVTDIAWCKSNIKADRLHFSEGHSDIQDMMIMSACDHHIIANSTFSWWAAWLNPRPDKRVISPRVWANPGESMVTDDLIPPSWEMI